MSTTPGTPLQMATVPMDVLRNQQWDLAVLFMQCLSRPLTVQEVQAKINDLRSVISMAEITWRVE